MSIKEKALLVSLSVSIWTNSAADGTVVSDIMKKTQTETDVHRYKKVLIKPEALAQVRAARVALRRDWWDNTLPWGNGGVRLLPSARYQSFAEKMRELRVDYERTVAAFTKEYPKMKAEARQRLHALFREEDFPPVERIKSKFGCSLEFAPIPDAQDFRVSLSEDERKEIRREVEKSVEVNTRMAMTSLVTKLHETLTLLSERMKEAEPNFRSSLIANVEEVCREVESFNLLDDKKIEGFRKAAEALTKNLDVDTVKADKKVRKDLATKADDILAKMASYIGDTQ